ncbi:MAG: hypothetical protein WDN24_06345 [Sphingomonas sp.]
MLAALFDVDDTVIAPVASEIGPELATAAMPVMMLPPETVIAGAPSTVSPPLPVAEIRRRRRRRFR